MPNEKKLTQKEILARKKEKEKAEKRANRKKHLLGSLVIIACYGLLLGIIFPLAADTSNKRILYLIIFCALLILSLLAYWIYIFFYARKQKRLMDIDYIKAKSSGKNDKK